MPKVMFFCSVSGPLHFDAVPDPRIRFRDNGSGSSYGSGSDSGSDLKFNKFKFFLSYIFSVKGIKLITMFFCCNFELIIHVPILNKISDFFLKNYILIILVDLFVNYFLLPRSGSTFPEVDPDPAK